MLQIRNLGAHTMVSKNKITQPNSVNKTTKTKTSKLQNNMPVLHTKTSTVLSIMHIQKTSLSQ